MKRIKNIESNLEKVKGQLVLPETNEGAKLPRSNFLVKYGLTDDESNLINFNINSFTQVGFEDPFPDDDMLYDGSLDDVDPEIYKLPETPY